MKSAPKTWHARVARDCRLGTDGMRRTYAVGRRAVAWPRTLGRHWMARRLGPSDIEIPWDRGFAMAPPAAFDHAALVDQACEARDVYFAAPRPGARKTFLVDVLPSGALPPDSVFLRFALTPGIIAAVSRYLGVVPVLTAVKVFHSDATVAAPISSQLYHCDGDDVAQIKVFVHCGNVTPESGPLTILPADASATVRKATAYQYRSRLTDEQVERVCPVPPVPALGPAGTVCLVDTSRCFHFGSRVAPGAPPRLVVMLQYQTPYSFMLPIDFRAAAPYRYAASVARSPLERLVLGEN